MKILAFGILLGSSMCSQGAPELGIRIIYDNTAHSPEYAADWGFAALVNHRGKQILFDTGYRPELFLENAQKLGIDWKAVSQVLISHAHMDHSGGMTALSALSPGIIFHFLDRFPASYHEMYAKSGVRAKRVTAPFELAPGVYSTGAIDGAPPEQSLVIETRQGLVILTGCSHPGITKIVETAEKQRGKNSVHLLIGGFHMVKASAEEIRATVSRLEELKVRRIMPAHCTGDAAIARFREAFGERCEAAGAGRRIVLE